MTDLNYLSHKSVNDIASFKKDQALGVEFNIVKVLLSSAGGGMSVQQAMDTIDGMLNNCYRRWYSALAEMPIWGEETDYQVLRYVEICRDVALGCLHWRYVFFPKTVMRRSSAETGLG